MPEGSAEKWEESVAQYVTEGIGYSFTRVEISASTLRRTRAKEVSRNWRVPTVGNSATQAAVVAAAVVAAAVVVFNVCVTCKPANHNSGESNYFFEIRNWKQLNRR